MVCTFPHLDWTRIDTKYLSVFSPNVGKHGPEKTPYLDTFHTVLPMKFSGSIAEISFYNDLETLEFKTVAFSVNHGVASWNHWTSKTVSRIQMFEKMTTMKKFRNYVPTINFSLRWFFSRQEIFFFS